MRLADLADEAGVEPFADLADAFAGVALVPHLRDHLVGAGGLGEGTGLEDIMRDGLLDVDVLARAHAGHGDVGVRMVRGGDDDGVDVLALLEHDAEVGEGFRLRELLDGPRAALQVEVAQGDDVLVGAVADVASADAAEADGRDIQLRVGGDGRRGGVEPRAGEGETGRGQAGMTKEAAPIEWGAHGSGLDSGAGRVFPPTDACPCQLVS